MTTIGLKICIGFLLATKVEVTDGFFTNFQLCEDVEHYLRSGMAKRGEHPTLNRSLL